MTTPDSGDRQTFDLLRDYYDWLPEYQQTLKELFEVLRLNHPHDIFDAGCGLGASTLAIGRVFPASHIYAVTLNDRPEPEVIEELKPRLIFEKKNIIDGLKNSKKKFDLFLLARVPRHGINTKKDYEILAGSLNTHGYVLTIGDCSLDNLYLGQFGFSMVDISADTRASALKSQLWQKTSS